MRSEPLAMGSVLPVLHESVSAAPRLTGVRGALVQRRPRTLAQTDAVNGPGVEPSRRSDSLPPEVFGGAGSVIGCVSHQYAFAPDGEGGAYDEYAEPDGDEDEDLHPDHIAVTTGWESITSV